MGTKWTKQLIVVCKRQVPVLYTCKPAVSGQGSVIELRDKEMSLLGRIERSAQVEDSKEAIEADIHIFLQGCLRIRPGLFR